MKPRQEKINALVYYDCASIKCDVDSKHEGVKPGADHPMVVRTIVTWEFGLVRCRT